MSYYASDSDIENEIFDEESIGSENTITSGRNTAIKTRIQARMNAVLRLTTLKTDTYGELKAKFLEAYALIIDGKPLPEKSDKFWKSIRSLHASKPLVIKDVK
jgi:hypothetical protein